MRIKKDDSVAVAIDIQTKLFPFIHENKSLEETTLKFIEGLKTLEIPMIVTEQYPKGIGPTLPSVKDRLGEAYKPIEKLAFSCCSEPAFMEALRQTGRKNVIVFGIETHVCVLQTVLDLIAEGYRPAVVADCVSSRKELDKQTALARMRQEGATVTTYESLLFELTEASGTPQFKAISKIVK